MKFCFGWLISITMLMMTATAFGQSGLTLVKHEFKPGEMQRLDTNDSLSAASDSSSSLPRADSMSAVTTTSSSANRRGNSPGLPDPPNSGGSEDLSRGGQRYLQIAVELRNSSGKKIVGFDLDCVLLEKDDKEYLRYRLVSDKALKSGENDKIKKTLTAKNLPEGASAAKVFGIAPLTTKVEIVAVRFEDGTVWTIPK